MCGEPLAVAVPSRSLADSPAPVLASSKINENIEIVKISFRQGGDKDFYQKLKDALVQKKWLLKDAPPVPKPSLGKIQKEVSGGAGIIGLERRGVVVRKQNEAVMSTAFEDLEALMAAAKDMVKTISKLFRNIVLITTRLNWQSLLLSLFQNLQAVHCLCLLRHCHFPLESRIPHPHHITSLLLDRLPIFYW